MRLSSRNPLDISDQYDVTRSMRAADEFLEEERVKSRVRRLNSCTVLRIRRT